MRRRKAKHGVCGVCGRAVVMSSAEDVSNRRTRVRCEDHADVVALWDWEIIKAPAGKAPTPGAGTKGGGR